MIPRRDVTLMIAPGGDRGLKITWYEDANYQYPYFLNPGTLDGLAARVRTELEGVVAAVVAGEQPSKELQVLAAAGYELRSALFRGDPESREHSRAAEEWLLGDEFETPPRISLVVPYSVHVPWGLLYDDDPSEISYAGDSLTTDQFSAFWCLK